jgi:hypothetical protein
MAVKASAEQQSDNARLCEHGKYVFECAVYEVPLAIDNTDRNAKGNIADR